MKRLLIIGLIVVLGCAQTVKTNTNQPPKTQEEIISELIKQLGNNDRQKREDAQKKLEEIGESVEPLIKKVQESSDTEVRIRVSYLLKLIAVKKRVNFSQSFLKEYPDIYRDLARFTTAGKFAFLQQIITRDEKGHYKHSEMVTNSDIAGLIGEILSENGQGLSSEVKQTILYISTDEYNPIPESVFHLIKLLKDSDAYIRQTSVQTLVDLNAKKAIPEVINLLKDCNAQVRASSAYALGKFDAKETIPELIKLLKDEDASVRCMSAEALGKLDAKETIPELIKLLKDGDGTVRSSSASALGELGAKEAILEIIRLLKDNNEWSGARMVYIDALVKLNAKEAIPELIKLLNNSDIHVRKPAVYALGKLGAKEANSELIKLLKDGNDEVRWASIDVLGKLGAKEATPELINLLKDTNPWIRRVSAVTLIELGAKNQVSGVSIDDIISLIGIDTEDYDNRVRAALKELGITVYEDGSYEYNK